MIMIKRKPKPGVYARESLLRVILDKIFNLKAAQLTGFASVIAAIGYIIIQMNVNHSDNIKMIQKTGKTSDSTYIKSRAVMNAKLDKIILMDSLLLKK